MFRIGEFARLAGVSAKMLRAWDELGLFRPAWVDPETAYRGYTPAQLPELRRLVALREVGVPLGDLRALVRGGADLEAVLAQRRRELDRDRREVERLLRSLDIRVEMAGGSGRHSRADLDIVVRPVTSEAVALLRVDPPDRDIGEAFYELETCVRDQSRRAGRPPGAVVGADGGSTDLFVPVTAPIRSCGAVVPGRLPATRVACTLVRGSYAGLPTARTALDDWIRAVGLEPAGPLRILYLQFGAERELRVPERYLVDRAGDLLTELQQPVQPDG